FSPRPARGKDKRIRKFYYNGAFEYIENNRGRVDTRMDQAEFAIDFQNSDRLNLKATRTYEFLPSNLVLAPGVVVPSGGYDYGTLLAGYNLGSGRREGVANMSLEYGTFYGGHKTTFTLSNGLRSIPPHIIMEPTYSYNKVVLRQGSFANHL